MEVSCSSPALTPLPSAAAAAGEGEKAYPAPTAPYEQVVSDAALFFKTLEGFHRSMGTKFMVPTIGGKALDLYRLFVEVTSRGGLEKVIGERKWRDVIATFSFPATITSASFVLRKYYISLLHPYEQVYFFQNESSKILVGDDLSTERTLAAVPTGEKDHHALEKPSLQSGCRLTGKIIGKFENGYIISANFGHDVLRGVLYHVPSNSPDPYLSASLASEVHGRKKRQRAMKDPSRPKSHRSGYNFFFAEHCSKLKILYSREERAIKIADMWNNLSSTEKEVYQQKGVQDVERYRNEMLEYRKSFTT